MHPALIDQPGGVVESLAGDCLLEGGGYNSRTLGPLAWDVVLKVGLEMPLFRHLNLQSAKLGTKVTVSFCRVHWPTHLSLKKIK